MKKLGILFIMCTNLDERMKFFMKVLTVKQPWATLIVEGIKKYEFRSWKTKYRGEVLIHAGLSEEKEEIKNLNH